MPASVLNLSAINAGSYPFINLFHGILNFWGGTWTNASGYPVASPGGTFGTTLTLPASYTDYIIDWTGTLSGAGVAAIQLAGSGKTVTSGGAFVVGATTFNLSMGGTDGRVRFTYQPDGGPDTFNVLIGISPSNVTSLRLYRAEHESLINSGEIFNPDYLHQIEEINPAILRFLDWSGVNGGTNGRTRYEKPEDHFSFAVSYFYPDAYVGAISGTDTYTCGNSAEGNAGAYVDGEMVWGTVTNTNTVTTPTLNRNSLGAKTIVDRSGNALSAGLLTVGGGKTFVYNALTDKWIYDDVTEFGLKNGVPYEIMIALCNKLNKSAWLQIPNLYDNASALSIISRARTLLNPGLSLYKEWSNEVWNAIMPQTHMSERMADAIGISQHGYSWRRAHGWYGLRNRQIWELAASTWSPRSLSQLKRVNAFQLYGDQTSINQFRFKGGDLFSVASGLTVTMTIASPCVVSFPTPGVTGVAPTVGQKLVFSTTGALPTGLSVATNYYIVALVGDGFQVQISATQGGAAINTSGSQSGVHTAVYTNLSYQTNIGIDYNAAPNRPIDYAECMSYATYYQGAQLQPFSYIQVANSKSISGVTKANPGVVTTSAAHGRSTGNRVYFEFVVNMSELNGVVAQIVVLSPTTFSIGIDTSGYVSAGTGGSVWQVNPMTALFAAADAFNIGDTATSRAFCDATIRGGTDLTGAVNSETMLDLSSSRYPGWEAIRLSFGKQIAGYEGGLQIRPPTATECTQLGKSTAYVPIIDNMIIDFKTSDLFAALSSDQFWDQCNSSADQNNIPAWYYFCVPNAMWSTHQGDLYSTKFASYYGMKLFNNNRRRVRLTVAS